MLGARGFWGRGRKEDRDRERDPSRMHEGYMLEVLTRFGGHAESSDDGGAAGAVSLHAHDAFSRST